jgi:hypothetical protein
MPNKRSKQDTIIRNAIGRNPESIELYIEVLSYINERIGFKSKQKVIKVLKREQKASKGWFKDHAGNLSFINNPIFNECEVQYPGLYDGLYHIIGMFKVMNFSNEYIKSLLIKYITLVLELQASLPKSSKLSYKDPLQICGQMIVSSASMTQIIDLLRIFDKDININYKEVEEDIKSTHRENEKSYSHLSQGSLVNPYYLSILLHYDMNNINLNAEPALKLGLCTSKLADLVSGFIRIDNRIGNGKLMTQSIDTYELILSGEISAQIYDQLSKEIISYITLNSKITTEYLKEELEIHRTEIEQIITLFFKDKHYEDIFHSENTSKLSHFTCIKLVNEILPKLVSLLLNRSNLLSRGLKETKNKQLNKSIEEYEKYISREHFESLLSHHIFSNPGNRSTISGDMSNSHLYSNELFKIVHTHYSTKMIKSFHKKSFQLAKMLLEDKEGLKSDLKEIIRSLK